MDNTCLFSIIIPIYNCSLYIEKCIESILKQTFNNFELLLIDDGSTDDSGKICDKYAKQNNNIKVFHKENGGVSSARNYGIKKSCGKYIIFIDSDDYIKEDYLEFCNSLMEEYKIQLLNTGFNSVVIDKNGTHIDKIYAKEKYYDTVEKINEDIVYLWDKHMLYNVWNKVYLSEIIKKHNILFPEYNFGEDMEFNINYLNFVDKFYNSSKCYYYYVKEREGSITKNYREDLFDIRLNEFHKFNNYFENIKIKRDKYIEFTSRRYIERLIGCVENLFNSKLSFKKKYKLINTYINHDVTRKSIKHARLNSKKMKLLVFPIKHKMIITTMIFGKICNYCKNNFPGIFNKLKNKR